MQIRGLKKVRGSLFCRLVVSCFFIQSCAFVSFAGMFSFTGCQSIIELLIRELVLMKNSMKVSRRISASFEIATFYHESLIFLPKNYPCKSVARGEAVS